MAKTFLTDEEVENEIVRLSNTEEVKLARKEMRLKYKRRQNLYQLRNLEKRGRELMEVGVNLSNIDELFEQEELFEFVDD